MVTPYFSYHKLTQVANKYCSHYGKILKKMQAFTFAKQCLNHCFAQKTVVLYYSSMHIPEANSFYLIYYSSPILKIFVCCSVSR